MAIRAAVAAAVVIVAWEGFGMGGSEGYGVRAAAAEMYELRRFVAVKLLGPPEPVPEKPYIEVVANHHPVQANARVGRPLSITGRIYHRGLFCHANSKLIVHLAAPAMRLHADIGVDSNEQTRGGRGSVVFRVLADGREVYRSGLMREGMGPEHVRVALPAAAGLMLEVGDGRDGIVCDQADWAEARVTPRYGSVAWLGDLPIQGL